MVKLLKRPDTTNIVVAVLIEEVLTAKVEVLFPCVVRIILGTAPIVEARKTTDKIFLLIEIIQLSFCGQKPVAVTIQR